MKYRVLLNGGYFNRVEGSLYHAGLLSLYGERQTPLVFDNLQLTHFVCIGQEKKISFIPNALYEDTLLENCSILFQAGPLIYSKSEDTIETNYMQNAYIGRAHKRTVMVVFEKERKQDLWFLTVNEAVTLSEVRNIVLRETRFIGTYDNLFIFNLDGGSSVAHMNRGHSDLNIGRTKILPIVF